jgi:hypothetical protein
MSTGKKWNRSSAFPAIVLAILNKAKENALHAAFEKNSTLLASLPDDQRRAMGELIIKTVSDEIAKFAESLKPYLS